MSCAGGRYRGDDHTAYDTIRVDPRGTLPTIMSVPILTAVIIARDEEESLKELIPSLQSFVDHIVVVDGGSSDGTVAIAERLGARVIPAPDWQGYGIQRRRGEEAVPEGWIFMIDADERVPPPLAEEIRRAILEGEHHPAVYTIPRLSWVFGKFLRHGGWYPDRVARLYRKETAGFDESVVHEKLVPRATIPWKHLRSPLLHFTYRDLEHYLVKSAHYAALAGSHRHACGRKTSLARACFHGIWCFFRMYLLRGGFLDGKQGFLIALLSAHSVFCKYADAWVRAQPSPATASAALPPSPRLGHPS